MHNCGHHLKNKLFTESALLDLPLPLISLMERLISCTLDKDSSPRSSSHVVSFLVAINPKIREHGSKEIPSRTTSQRKMILHNAIQTYR